MSGAGLIGRVKRVIEHVREQGAVDPVHPVGGGDQSIETVAHAANPDYVGRHASEVVGPNGYPAGEVVASVADEDGEWSSYIFTNSASGAVETKHTWAERYDGLVFGSGGCEA